MRRSNPSAGGRAPIVKEEGPDAFAVEAICDEERHLGLRIAKAACNSRPDHLGTGPRPP